MIAPLQIIALSDFKMHFTGLVMLILWYYIMPSEDGSCLHLSRELQTARGSITLLYILEREDVSKCVGTVSFIDPIQAGFTFIPFLRKFELDRTLNCNSGPEGGREQAQTASCS